MKSSTRRSPSIAEVGAFDRIEHVAPAPVGLRAARRVRERQEDAAAVALEPVEIERQLLTRELERRSREAAEQDRLIATRADLPQLRLGRPHLGQHTQLRRVVEILETGEVAALRLRERRLRVGAEQVVTTLSPQIPCRSTSDAERTDW